MKETQRLHDLSKSRDPLPRQDRKKSRLPTPEDLSDYSMGFDSDDDLPSDLGSSDLASEDERDEAEGSGTTTLDDDELSLSDDSEDGQSDLNDAFDDVSDESSEDDAPQRHKKRKEEEADYEKNARARWAPGPAKPEEDSVEVGRLPIKLPSGEVQKVAGTTRIAIPQGKKKPVKVESETEEEDIESEDEGSDDGAQANVLAGKKGRFGRLGVAEVVGMPGMKAIERLGLAKEQIAQVGAEILAGGELIDIVSCLYVQILNQS